MKMLMVFIREYLPKKTDFNNVTASKIKEIEIKINKRPRKRLQYKTPTFVMQSLLKKQSSSFVT